MLRGMFRNEVELEWRWSNREIRQYFGVSNDLAVTELTV
jgi:hypothetical protein